MDIKNFNKKLTKISALTDTSSETIQLSSLERDLLLSYIRDLYDLALDNMPAKNQTFTPEPKTQEKPIIHTQPVATFIEEPIVPAPTKVMTPEPPKEEVIIPTVITENIEVQKPIQIEQVAASVSPDVSIGKPASQSNDLIAELFADEKVSDLSDKLALSPVKDLTKSMGINERIFTQQELFGNNQTLFNDTLQRLNNCQNFAEAKQYLLDNVISTYDWTNEHKIKKAATFVKLVKRKFS